MLYRVEYCIEQGRAEHTKKPIPPEIDKVTISQATKLDPLVNKMYFTVSPSLVPMTGSEGKCTICNSCLVCDQLVHCIPLYCTIMY